MSKITRAHIIAARARRNILNSQKKPVPSKITKLADLDLTKFPRSASAMIVHGRHSTPEVRPADGGWVVSSPEFGTRTAQTQTLAIELAEAATQVSETNSRG